jgi:hypothetical protein
MEETTFASENPTGYQRGLRFGALWTMILSPYLILYFIFILLIGGLSDNSNMAQTLEFAGKSLIAFDATVFLDGLFHVLFIVTVVTLFAILRTNWPVRANLILAAGVWQMLMGFTKALISMMSFNQLGAAYIHADPALQNFLIPVAASQDGIRMALQWMDSLGVLYVWVLVSLLPSTTGLSRAIRWLGWIMAVSIIGPDPGFLLVVLLSPAWLFLLGRWMNTLVPSARAISSASKLDNLHKRETA